MARSKAGGGPQPDRHAQIHGEFRWHVPARFNLAEVCCGRWARDTPEAIAVHHERANGERTAYTFARLQADANRLSHWLVAQGVQRGDRVAIVMPQRYETVVSHMALYQLGAVAMPLSQLFGPEALAYRLQNSEAVMAIADESAMAALRTARTECPALRTVLAVGEAEGQGDADWRAALAGSDTHFTPVDTAADDAAILIYTSGTTGPPKGALLPHRALIGNLPGFVCSYNGFTAPEGGPVVWSPADWAWTGGLIDVLLPVLYFGRPLVGYSGRFDPETAFGLMQRHGVTHTFLFPTALKAMMKAVPAPRQRFPRLRLQAVMAAGEPVGDAVMAWCRDVLQVPMNEMFGQTEMNYIVGNCGGLPTAYRQPPSSLRSRPPKGALSPLGRPGGTEVHIAPGWPAKPGSMGRAYPGHRIAVIDDEGRECPRGTPGDVALHRRDVHGDLDPIFFLGYWRNERATAAKFTGDPLDSWCRTGDTAVMDEDGYLWYQGRSDDVFKAAGYRIGPSEIENCLVKHPAVLNAAVVPKPDAERGAVVKAYVVLAPGHAPGDALVGELQAHVRGRLAPYEYPKEIEFTDSLPMTVTGMF